MQPKDKHIIVIIPARGGSRRIDKKNLVPLAGKPMITHTIQHALAAKHVHRVIVSTEDKQIAAVSRKYGAEVFARPLELASDASSSESALLRVLDQIRQRGEQEPDLVVFLQCTSPIRRRDDIDNAIRTLEQTGADSLFSAARNFGLIWAERADNIYALTYDYKNRRREQEIEKQYHENGSIYVFKPAILRSENNRLGGKIAIYEMDRWCSFQVDHPDDIELINYILRHKIR